MAQSENQPPHRSRRINPAEIPGFLAARRQVADRESASLRENEADLDLAEQEAYLCSLEEE